MDSTKVGQVYTVLAPDGVERVLGVFSTDASARRAYRRRYPEDARKFNLEPVRKREPRPGDPTMFGEEWTG